MSVLSPNFPAQSQEAIIRAVSRRSNQTHAQAQVRAAAAKTNIQALAPDDALEAMLVGQLVVLQEIFAAAAHDLLNGIIDPMRLKGQASLLNIARVTQGHVDRLRRMAKQSGRAAVPPARIVQPA